MCSGGPLTPVKVFRPGLQFLYNKTKCGVGGSTQEQAVFRSSTSRLSCKTKLFTQTVRTIVVNAFMVRLMLVLHNRDLKRHGYQTLDQYRKELNNVGC